MYTPVNPSFTKRKWGLRGSKLYRYVFVMYLRIVKDAKFLHADNKVSDQNARMRRLSCVFVVRIYQKVRLLTPPTSFAPLSN